jgi:flagellar biosynthesis/type III secretory pathway protein FliH
MTALFSKNFDLKDGFESGPQPQPEIDRVYNQQAIDAIIEKSRHDGFSDGYEKGVKEGSERANSTIRANIEVSLDVLNQNLENLLQQVKSDQNRIEKHVLAIVLNCAKRVLPVFEKTSSTECAIESIRHIVAQTHNVPLLNIQVSQSTLRAIQEDGIEFLRPPNHDGVINLDENKELLDGDARMVWDRGWSNYSLNKISAQIVLALQSALPTKTRTTKG